MSLSHAAKAEALIADELQGGSFDQTRDYIAIAQVHATLALMEQQRIANLIALSRIEAENQSTPTDALDAIYDREDSDGPFSSPKLRTTAMIREGLGLS